MEERYNSRDTITFTTRQTKLGKIIPGPIKLPLHQTNQMNQINQIAYVLSNPTLLEGGRMKIEYDPQHDLLNIEFLPEERINESVELDGINETDHTRPEHVKY